MHIEKGAFVQNFKDLPGNINARTISAGVLSGFFTLTTVLILIRAGAEAHLDPRLLVSCGLPDYP